MEDNELTILFVDDEKDIVKKMCNYLKRYTKNVYYACNYLEIQNICKKISPDVVFLDFNLQDSNGIEILKQIRKKDDKTLIIIHSANSEAKTIQEVKSYNIFDYIVKPITRNEIQKVIRNIDKKQRLKENA